VVERSDHHRTLNQTNQAPRQGRGKRRIALCADLPKGYSRPYGGRRSSLENAPGTRGAVASDAQRGAHAGGCAGEQLQEGVVALCERPAARMGHENSKPCRGRPRLFVLFRAPRSARRVARRSVSRHRCSVAPDDERRTTADPSSSRKRQGCYLEVPEKLDALLAGSGDAAHEPQDWMPAMLGKEERRRPLVCGSLSRISCSVASHEEWGKPAPGLPIKQQIQSMVALSKRLDASVANADQVANAASQSWVPSLRAIKGATEDLCLSS